VYTEDDLVTGLNQSKVVIVEGVKFLAWERHILFFDASRQAARHKRPVQQSGHENDRSPPFSAKVKCQ
jgi:hypothetical protein